MLILKRILVEGTAIKKSHGSFYCPQEYENGRFQAGEIYSKNKTKNRGEKKESLSSD